MYPRRNEIHSNIEKGAETGRGRVDGWGNILKTGEDPIGVNKYRKEMTRKTSCELIEFSNVYLNNALLMS